MIFTASIKEYADEVIDNIDPDSFIRHRLYRKHTTFREGVYLKDLHQLNRDLKKIVILDNSIDNFALQPLNGIYIKSWVGDQEDRVLL